MKTREEREAARNLGTMIALVAIVMFGLALLALVAVVLPKIVWLVVVVGGFVLMGLFHYITWGWWLARVPFEEEDDG